MTTTIRTSNVLTLAIVAVGTLLPTATSLSAANLVANGDFSSNAGSFTTFPGYTGAAGNPAAIDDWTKQVLFGVINVGVNGSGVGFGPPEPFAPSSTAGVDNFAFIQRGGAGMGLLSQSIALLPNTKYKISWDAANRAGAGNVNAMGRVQVGDNTTEMFNSGNTTWGNSSFTSHSGTFRTGSSFDGTPSVQLYNLTPASEGTDKTVAYSNIVVETTNEVVLPTIANADFETRAAAFVTPPGYTGAGANPAQIPSWDGSGAGGRGINPGGGAGAAFRNNGNDLTNVAFIQANTSTISQSIAGWEVGEDFRIDFNYNSRAHNLGDQVGLTATIGAASFVDSAVPPVNAAGAFTNSYYSGNILFTPTTATNTLSVTTNATADKTILVDNFRVFRNGPTIAENGFEAPNQGANTWKQANGNGGGSLAGSQWTISGGAGITQNISPFQNGIPAPEGIQHALIQGTSGSFTQTITGFELAEYELSLLTMARQGQNFGNDLEVVLDAGLPTEVVLIDIPEVTFSSFTEIVSPSFFAKKDTYELTIRASLDGGNLSGDRTTFFDNVWFNQLTDGHLVPEPSTFVLFGMGLVGLAGVRRRRNRG